MQPYLDAHLGELTAMVDRMLELIGAPRGDEASALLVTAVIEGLTWAACLGRIPPERATELAITYVTSLGPAHDAGA